MTPFPMRLRLPCMLSGLLFTAVLSAQAQAQDQAQVQSQPQSQSQSPSTTRADPLDAKAPIPAVRYESAFAKFRRIGDDKPVAWRQANDAVARIGGWRVYARQAQQPDPAAADQPEAPAPAPAPAPAARPLPLPAGPAGHKQGGPHDGS